MQPFEKPVLCEVEFHLELLEPFEPQRLGQIHAGCPNVLAELLIGSPRMQRDAAELEVFAELTSLEAKASRSRLDPPLLARLGRVLDQAFTALDFDIVGRCVSSVRNFNVLPLSDWRAISPIWLCWQPLKQIPI
jgi:hypothetical protein